jgi:arylsulfatase A-like enzyme
MPNVLWVMTDEQQFQTLSCAGHPVVETPNLDRLADRGVRFDRAYCPAPACGPSRGALFTGRYPWNNGMTGNNAQIDDGVELLPELLADAGYHTGLVGKLHFKPKAAPHGFEHRRLHDAMYDLYDPEEPWTSDYVEWLAEKRFDGDATEVIERANADEALMHEDSKQFFLGANWRAEGEHSNDWTADESVAYLREHREEPFFLFASFFAPHHQHLAPGEWGDLYDPEDVPLPDGFDLSVADRPVGKIAGGGKEERFADLNERDYREILAAYYGLIAHVDHCVGRVLDELEAQGLREDTLVVFTSDHGDHAGQFGWFTKGNMYANSVRVPLVVDAPDGASGAATDHVVNNLGLFDTVLEWCGVDAPETSSRSLAPLLNDPHRDDWTDRTYAEIGDPYGPETMLVDGDLKLMRTRDENRRLVHELYDTTERPLDATDLFADAGVARKRDLLGELDLAEARAAAGEPVVPE